MPQVRAQAPLHGLEAMGAAQQKIYDAIKQARETGEAWITYKGERLKRPL